jgi:hypothetical protein
MNIKPKFYRNKNVRDYYKSDKRIIENMFTVNLDDNSIKLIKSTFFTYLFKELLSKRLLEEFLSDFISYKFPELITFKFKKQKICYFFEFNEYTFFIEKSSFYIVDGNNIDIENDFKKQFLYIFYDWIIKNHQTIFQFIRIISFHRIISKLIDKNKSQFYLNSKMEHF